ncbi:MAG: hypothetical protein GEV08_10965 [Acidimicrobiia bacterium]|nr:hypothetical protein [Acidimicrobiia bacterium]
MARTKKVDKPLRRGERVVATADLPGIPEGTPGRVHLINGLTWRRYWVFFDNGVKQGSIDGKYIVRAKDYESFKARRAAEAEAGEAAAPAAAEDEAPAAEAPAEDGTASKVPAHLLERAKRAKERRGLA